LQERPLELQDSGAWLFPLVSTVPSSRCVWLTLAIFVGAARELIPELIERAKKLKVSGGFEDGTDM